MEPRRQHEPREHRPRTGDEPMHARSPLRMRLVLAVVGLVNGLLGVGIFGFWLRALPFAIFFGLVTVIALGNIAVVVHHIRQGPHYQPGRDVPPYHPVEREPEPAPVPRPASPTRRHVRYVIMMGTCLLLIILAWTWVRFYSVFAAGVMSVIAALLPPISAMMANADSPILRDGDEDGDGNPDEADPDGRPPVPGSDEDRRRPPPD